jgi:hypothetical protein
VQYVASLQPLQRRKGKMSPTEDNKAVIRRFLEEVINQNHLDRADDLVLEEFVELDPFPGQRQG